MMFVTIRMHVLPEKCKEFMQTVKSLAELMRNENGCIACHLYRDVDEENVFGLIKCWTSQEHLSRYLKSDNFAVFRGALSFLTEKPDIHSFSKENASGLRDLIWLG